MLYNMDHQVLHKLVRVQQMSLKQSNNPNTLISIHFSTHQYTSDRIICSDFIKLPK